MVQFTAIILKFEKQGEKTSWTYIEVSAAMAQKLKPGNKRSFRIKGKLDNFALEKTAILPMGNGQFILPLNAAIRKGIGKRKGAILDVRIEEDNSPVLLNAALLECLGDEPQALQFFNTLTKSHQHYFSKWIEGAKTELTKTKRLVQSVNALSRCGSYSDMLRSGKA